MSPTSSRNSVPLSAIFEAPDLLRNRTGKGTLLMTETTRFPEDPAEWPRSLGLIKARPTTLTGVVNGREQ